MGSHSHCWSCQTQSSSWAPITTSAPESFLLTNVLCTAVPRLFYCFSIYQHPRGTGIVPKFRAVHVATLWILRLIARWLLKVPNQAVRWCAYRRTFCSCLCVWREYYIFKAGRTGVVFVCVCVGWGFFLGFQALWLTQFFSRRCFRSTHVEWTVSKSACLLKMPRVVRGEVTLNLRRAATHHPRSGWQDRKKLERQLLLVAWSWAKFCALGAGELSKSALSAVGRFRTLVGRFTITHMFAE